MSEFAFVKWASTVQLTGRRETREVQRLILHYVVSQGRRSGSSFWCQTPDLKEWSKIMGLHAKRIVRARQQLSQDGILLPVSGRKRVQKRRLTLHPDIVREILNGSLPTVPVKHKTSQDNVQSNGMGSEGTPSPERQDVTEEADTAQNASESSDWEIREVRNYVSEVVSYQKRVPGTEHWTSIDGSEYWDIRERGRLLAWNEANPIIRLT